MKKYMIPLAALLMVAGIANAQSAQKKNAGSPVVKMSKPATKNVSSATGSVTPSASAPVKKANTGVAIKRKHYHKKSRSVKPKDSK